MSGSGRRGPTSVAATKLQSPSAPRTLVDRTRLVRAFTDDPTPVTLICGPAGAGKTTLLVSWLAAHRDPDLRVAWLDLDRHDDEPFLLWNALLAALRASNAFAEDDPFHALRSPQGGPDGAFLAELMGAVERLEQPLWLVLDDVHELTDPAALASLDLMLRRLPKSLRLVLSSRTDPPLGLQRLRLAGALREIRIGDLAFTPEEAAELLARHAVTIAEPLADELLIRTEGWAAGLQIAALALADDPDPRGFMQRFNGNERAVADYLVAEILGQRTPETRRFLYETSTCARIAVDLAEQLTGRHDVGRVLDGLVRENALTVLVGEREPVYRYHELLRSYLQAELRRSDGQEHARLHRATACWYDDRGDGAHALEHAMLARDGELTLRLLRSYGCGLILDGHGAELTELLDALAPPWTNAPIPSLLRAAVSLHRLGLVPSDAGMLSAIDALPTCDDPWLVALHAIVELHRARLEGTPSAALEHALTTSAGATGDGDLDLLALQHLGTSRVWSGEYQAAANDLEQAVTMATARGRDAIAVACLSALAGAASGLSEFSRMRDAADRALQLAAARGWNQSPIAANAHVSRAAGSYLRGDPEDASEHARLAVDALGTHIDAPIELGARCMQAFCDVELGGDAFKALCSIRDAWADTAGREIGPALHAFAIPMEIRLCLMVGQSAWATEAAERTLRRFDGYGEAAFVSALLLTGKGQVEAAREALAPILRGDLACLVRLTEISAWLLEAEHAASLQLDRYAFDAVATALRMAEPDESLRPFIDAGGPIRELLLTHVGRFGRSEEFVARLLDMNASRGQPTNPLTASELSLLQDLPSLHTLGEIAQARHVSVNTVKTHLRAVYTKLDADSRRGAVREARRRGLL